MKKILKYSLLAVLALAAVTGCKKSELDTDQFSGFSLAAIAPNPVMRGAELRLIGSGLENATEVQFAGNVTVTDITVVEKGSRSEIRVIVPLEGPEVGKVTVVDNSGRKASTKADLTFAEAIEVESFSPASALSGDVLTFKGEYLNNVKEIIFGGEDAVTVAFESQSRHELTVKVPANAISGPVILSDVNEIEDENTIPNHIYTKSELTVGNPTVTKAAKATYKSGDVITVKGAHLDMIKNVALPQQSGVDFTVAEDATSISFNLPPKASDGEIILTSFAGVDFSAGEIETVNVTELSVTSLATDNRFKAGTDVEISGSDLDLVTKVEFTGAEASWYTSGGKIIATQPAEAKDGIVTVTLESGKQAFSEEIEVVKPEVLGFEEVEAVVAGETVMTFVGLDLDLVESVKMGDKKQGFIDCAFEFQTDEFGDTEVKVAIPQQAYDGPITFTSAAGYETASPSFIVTYNMAVSIKFTEPTFGLGQNISVTGKNLLTVEQMFIKNKKVTSYSQRSDDAMSFAIPDGIGPGVYRLNLVLTDGTEMTWPIPFEITAPFTETFFWEGNIDLSGGAQPYLGDDGALAGSLVVGDLIRVYFTIPGDGWWFEIFDGHWEGMLFKATPENTDPDAGYCVFEVTEENIAQLTTPGGWGGVLVVQGSVTVTGASVIHFGAAEKRDVIWEGSLAIDWSGATAGAEGSMGALSWGGYDWSTVEPGTVLALGFERTADEVQIRLGNGSWVALPGTEDPYKPEGSELKVELTDAMIAEMVANGGLVITGQGYTLTEVALITTETVGPQEKVIWEGSKMVWWGSAGSDALSALAYGGFDWTTVAAGTILCAHYTIDDAEGGCIRFGNGSWQSIPSLAGLATDGNLPLVEGGVHEIELTAEDLAFLIEGDGMVICGNGYTITSVGLK